MLSIIFPHARQGDKFGLLRRPPLRGRDGRITLLFAQVSDELLEKKIIAAGCAGKKMPLCRFDRIGRRASPGGKDAGEAVLGDRTAAFRSAAEPSNRLRLVFFDSGTVEQPYRVFDGCIGVTLSCRRSEPS